VRSSPEAACAESGWEGGEDGWVTVGETCGLGVSAGSGDPRRALTGDRAGALMETRA